MQGTHNNSTNGTPLDLDAQLAEIELKPRKVRLGGKDYTIRRDLSGLQVKQYWALVEEGKDVDALAMICTAPVMLNRALENLPHEHMKAAIREIMKAAGVVNTRGESGES
jgi:hypothetical protein